MKIILIAALAHNRVIGKDNKMPWHLPADLQHFKKLTVGKPIIMGRKTFESLGRPLPGRLNVVITRQHDYTVEGCKLYHNLSTALSELRDFSEVVIMGGSEIYTLSIELADLMYLTYIDLDVAGDTFFPAWSDDHWREISREEHVADEKNPHSYAFVTLEKF